MYIFSATPAAGEGFGKQFTLQISNCIEKRAQVHCYYQYYCCQSHTQFLSVANAFPCLIIKRGAASCYELRDVQSHELIVQTFIYRLWHPVHKMSFWNDLKWRYSSIRSRITNQLWCLHELLQISCDWPVRFLIFSSHEYNLHLQNPTNAEIWTHYAKLLLGEKPLTVVTYQRVSVFSSILFSSIFISSRWDKSFMARWLYPMFATPAVAQNACAFNTLNISQWLKIVGFGVSIHSIGVCVCVHAVKGRWGLLPPLQTVEVFCG